jgi:hypothetical protein
MRHSLGPVCLTTWVVFFSAACGGVVRTGGSERENRDAAAARGSGGFGGMGEGFHTDPPSWAGGPSSAGYTSSGGASMSTGGAGGVDSSAYRCFASPPRDPSGYGMLNDPCCKTSVGLAGTCASESRLEFDPMRNALGHDTCGGDLRCLPAPLDAGTGISFASCSASLGAALNIEGRCVPRCFLGSHPRLSAFKQDGCATDELVCAPCFDPVDGVSTGACNELAGDHPSMPPPLQFSVCGAFDGGAPGGTCVPRTIVESSGYLGVSNGLHQDDCAANDVCVPTVKARDGRACFMACATSLSALGPDYVAGGCVPRFAVLEALDISAVNILERDVCAAGEVCAPCADPLNNGKPSHVCD